VKALNISSIIIKIEKVEKRRVQYISPQINLKYWQGKVTNVKISREIFGLMEGVYSRE